MMSVIMPNILFDVYRSPYTVGRGTGKALPHLYDQEGHISPIPARHVKMQQTSAVYMPYELRSAAGLDIKIGDIITNIRLISSGELWIDNDGGIQTWRVVDPYDMSPGPLSYRMIMVERVIGGGPAPV